MNFFHQPPVPASAQLREGGGRVARKSLNWGFRPSRSTSGLPSAIADPQEPSIGILAADVARELVFALAACRLWLDIVSAASKLRNGVRHLPCRKPRE
jgi:hypothetical protein